MAENKMKKLAKLLGVEINKPFNIKGYPFSPCILTKNGMINDDGFIANNRLFELLIGKLEIEKPILNDSEKDYLENVLRPFKDRIMYIEKKAMDFNYEYIAFKVFYEDSEISVSWFTLPCFDRGTMYKNMELNEHYMLDELMLFK